MTFYLPIEQPWSYKISSGFMAILWFCPLFFLHAIIYNTQSEIKLASDSLEVTISKQLSNISIFFSSVLILPACSATECHVLLKVPWVKIYNDSSRHFS